MSVGSRYPKRFLKKIMNAATIANGTAVDTDTVDSRGFNKLTFMFDHTWAAATSIHVQVDVSPDGTNWYPMQTIAVSAGVATCSELEYQKATGGASSDFALTYDCLVDYMRLNVEGVGGTTDTMTVYVVGAFQ